MRVAALYDIHGNLPALEAVLDEVRRIGVDRIVVGGDVLPGPMPRETLACLLDLDIPAQFIQGNGDRVVASADDGARSRTSARSRFARRCAGTPRQLRPEHDASPRGLAADAARGHRRHRRGAVLPRDAAQRPRHLHAPDAGSRSAADLRRDCACRWSSAATPTCSSIGRSAASRVVNAGSVGMPFQAPGAYWLLLGPGVELRRTPYDLAAAAARIRATQLPGRGAVRRAQHPADAVRAGDARDVHAGIRES